MKFTMFEKQTHSVKTKMATVIASVILAVALPWMFHALGRVLNIGTSAGEIFLPMHFPVMLAGFLAGPAAGLTAGILSPVISFMITGMPASLMLPFIVVELAVYGAVSGVVSNVRSRQSNKSRCDTFCRIRFVIKGKCTHYIHKYYNGYSGYCFTASYNTSTR